jgi:two-component system, OmpR family, flagellar system response regulator FtcR
MFVIVDDREIVTRSYIQSFEREGISSAAFSPQEFCSWIETAAPSDITAVEAFVLGDCAAREKYTPTIRNKSQAPVIAMVDSRVLDSMLRLFDAGVDDVVSKPVHVREILARARAISRRRTADTDSATAGEITVFFDGRDPLIRGRPLALPRRERRILEHLAACKGRLVTRAQIFSSVYGLFDEDIDEAVVESHISKLRKKLRTRLGYDPVESKRYLGYRLTL